MHSQLLDVAPAIHESFFDEISTAALISGSVSTRSTMWLNSSIISPCQSEGAAACPVTAMGKVAHVHKGICVPQGVAQSSPRVTPTTPWCPPLSRAHRESVLLLAGTVDAEDGDARVGQLHL